MKADGHLLIVMENIVANVNPTTKITITLFLFISILLSAPYIPMAESRGFTAWSIKANTAMLITEIIIPVSPITLFLFSITIHLCASLFKGKYLLLLLFYPIGNTFLHQISLR